MRKILKSPGKYVQGAGILGEIDEYLQGMGRRLLILISRSGTKRICPTLDACFQGKDYELHYEIFQGECSQTQIDRLTAVAREQKSTAVVGIGGGKTMDTAKAVADNYNAAVIIVPTTASTDAPAMGLSVIYTAAGEHVGARHYKKNPDLVLLDLNLPEVSGFQICRDIKRRSALPVLVLTSRDQLRDEVHALELGADEYLTKPYRKERLLARIGNVLKRYEGRPNLLEGADFLLDRQTYTLFIHNRSVVLPPNQGKLLEALLTHGGQTVTKDDLSRALWGTTEFIDENALQVNLTRLKKTMASLGMRQQLVSVRGVGYRLEVPNEA